MYDICIPSFLAIGGRNDFPSGADPFSSHIRQAIPLHFPLYAFAWGFFVFFFFFSFFVFFFFGWFLCFFFPPYFLRWFLRKEMIFPFFFLFL